MHVRAVRHDTAGSGPGRPLSRSHRPLRTGALSRRTVPAGHDVIARSRRIAAQKEHHAVAARRNCRGTARPQAYFVAATHSLAGGAAVSPCRKMAGPG